MRVAIIPARGGSKRIPRKNIKPFLGKPMIAYSIEVARACGLFDLVIVSTDDVKIMDTAKAAGAEVPFIRPSELSDDTTPTVPVLLHTIRELEKLGHKIEQACCIYATSLFTTVEDLSNSYAQMIKSDADTAFAVTTFAFPILRSLKMNEAGLVEMNWPEHRNTRSQDLPEAYHDAGQFYWFKTETLKKSENLYGGRSLGYKMPRHRVQDVDTPEDWNSAELAFELLKARGELG